MADKDIDKRIKTAYHRLMRELIGSYPITATLLPVMLTWLLTIIILERRRRN